MARSFNGKLTVRLEGIYSNTVWGSTDLAIVAIDETITHELANGSSTGQANRVWMQKGVSLPTTGTTIDLKTFAGLNIGGGAGNDVFGNAMDLTKVVAIILKNSSNSNGNITIQNTTTNYWTAGTFGEADILTPLVYPGGVAVIGNIGTALDVTASDKEIVLISGATAVTYDLAIVGRAT